jgi:hypothetical protein
MVKWAAQQALNVILFHNVETFFIVVCRLEIILLQFDSFTFALILRVAKILVNGVLFFTLSTFGRDLPGGNYPFVFCVQFLACDLDVVDGKMGWKAFLKWDPVWSSSQRPILLSREIHHVVFWVVIVVYFASPDELRAFSVPACVRV